MNEQQQEVEQWRKDLWELVNQHKEDLPLVFRNRLLHITQRMYHFSHKRTWWQRIKYKLGLIE